MKSCVCVCEVFRAIFICLGRVSSISGWPPTSYVVEDDRLRASDHPASTSHMLGLELYTTTPSLFGAGDVIQGLAHSRRMLYQVSYSPSPCVVHLWKYKVGLLKLAPAFWLHTVKLSFQTAGKFLSAPLPAGLTQSLWTKAETYCILFLLRSQFPNFSINGVYISNIPSYLWLPKSSSFCDSKLYFWSISMRCPSLLCNWSSNRAQLKCYAR